MAIPEQFCWTRFGTEAGEGITNILARKEQERLANGGVFFWGIGNAVGAGIQELVRRSCKPEVIFSPIKSRPRCEDVTPTAVAAWIVGETLDGLPFRLPSGSVVTSRYDFTARRHIHYALVCSSGSPLAINESDDKIEFGELRNLLSGRPMGPSQVTAVVQRGAEVQARRASYDIAIRAELVYPYFVRLQQPVRVLEGYFKCELSTR